MGDFRVNLFVIALILFFSLGKKHPDEPPPSPEDDPVTPPPDAPPRTAHFQLWEFADPNDGLPPHQYWGNIQRTMEALEVVRSYLEDRAITITGAGGWRSKATNASNPGRAKNSQHLEGRAADIVVDGVSPAEVFAAIDALQSEGQIPRGGAHAYNGFTHMDIRGWEARW